MRLTLSSQTVITCFGDRHTSVDIIYKTVSLSIIYLEELNLTDHLYIEDTE